MDFGKTFEICSFAIIRRFTWGFRSCLLNRIKILGSEREVYNEMAGPHPIVRL